MALSNTQYNILLRRYEAKQLENQHILMERVQAVYQEIPRLAEIDQIISSLSIQQAKKLIDGNDAALTELRSQLGELICEKKKLLASHGYPNDYFEPPYGCPDCQDTGYIVFGRLPLTWCTRSPISARFWILKTFNIFPLTITLRTS